MESSNELISLIDRLTRKPGPVEAILRSIESELARAIGGVAIALQGPGAAPAAWNSGPMADFMASRQFPFRGLYFANVSVVRNQTRESWRLIACFGTYGSASEHFPNLTAHLAKRVGEVLSRQPSSVVYSEAA